MAEPMGSVLASIPSPSTGFYHLGPFTLHMYGVMLLLAIAAAIWLTGRRWVAFGGDWDLVYRVAIYGVVAGVIGARIYHDLTSWNQDAAIHAPTSVPRRIPPQTPRPPFQTASGQYQPSWLVSL